jgi:phytoene dehydrogenase-like protein
VPAHGSARRNSYDAVIIGGGHNGLVAAALLARSGSRVLLLERREHVGGAAVSESPFPGVDVRLSRYAYLVSLFPSRLRRSLRLGTELRVRAVSSYTPVGDSGLLVGEDAATRASMTHVTGDRSAFEAWEGFHRQLGRVARCLAPTLTQPLISRTALRERLGDDTSWRALFEEPLSHLLERTFASDVLRGIVLTDACVGTFAAAGDPALRQNRCFLYHVIGDGTGLWKVPVGGMGALTAELAKIAANAGAEIRTHAEVAAIDADGHTAEVTCADGSRYRARHALANVAPAVLHRLLGQSDTDVPPEGSQLKLNLLLRRLPRIRDHSVTPERAFAGTFHVNEGYAQLQHAYDQASQGQIPTLPPCELYCHSLSDPTILSEELRAAGAHTLTVFGLHMPARLFTTAAAKQQAVANTIASINSVLAEPLEDCLARGPDGSPCVEARTPPELERELALPAGHIFHRDLMWPFAESAADSGTWGVETEHANVWLCGAGARRGGGVSGVPGHNAARAVLDRDSCRSRA